jgi:hypothetical protein
MNDESPDLSPFLHELSVEAKKVADGAGEAARLYADGDAQGACNAIAILHYGVAAVDELREAIVDDFEKQGITPQLV